MYAGPQKGKSDVGDYKQNCLMQRQIYTTSTDSLVRPHLEYSISMICTLYQSQRVSYWKSTAPIHKKVAIIKENNISKG